MSRVSGNYPRASIWRVLMRFPTIRKMIRNLFIAAALLLCIAQGPFANPPSSPPRWSEQASNDWYARQPWLVGSNYIPSNAINELEMWQGGPIWPSPVDLPLWWGGA